MRRLLIILVATVAVLAAAITSADAAVIDMGSAGKFGVAEFPGTFDALSAAGIATVTSSGACGDPALASDFGQSLPSGALCWHGGRVLHNNETFALTWDPLRRYWQDTLNFVENFLSDVAKGSGTLTSPYADTSQYSDSAGRAANASLYGGGCIDDGNVGGSACKFGNTTGTGPGHDYPSNGCPVSGFTQFAPAANGFTIKPNDVCLTDSQIQGEIAQMVSQEGILGRVRAGYSPLITLMTPEGVETCLDATAKLCSANATLAPPPPTVSTSQAGGTIPAGTYNVETSYLTPDGETVPSASVAVTTTGSTSTITIDPPPTLGTATGWYAYVTQSSGTSYGRQGTTANAMGSALTLTATPDVGPAPAAPAAAFCSYHSTMVIGGTKVPYVVQPWTALTGCDDPGIKPLTPDMTPQQISEAIGARLVSPLSQGQIAAIVNPDLDGWYAQDGSEVNDNALGGDRCIGLPRDLDLVRVGNGTYYLQREFNNASVIAAEPNTYGCTPVVILTPRFVVPSAVNANDVVEFDGGVTASTLLVPGAGYQWNFGDGATAAGASVVHSYAHGGTYTVTLTLTDRGGNTATLSQQITVLGPTGQPPGGGHPGGGGQKSHHHHHTGLKARIQLIPQGLGDVLRNGVAARVTSNVRASGFVTLVISRSDARKAHIAGGRHATGVVVGRGTVSQIRAGTAKLHFRLSSAVVARLKHLHHIAVTVRLALVTRSGAHLTVDAAGRY